MDAGVGTPARPSTVGIWMTVGEGDGDYDGGLKDGDCQPPTVSTLDAGQWNVVFGRMPENCLLRTALAHSRGRVMARTWSPDHHGDAQVVVVRVPFAWRESMGEATSAVHCNCGNSAPCGMRYCPKR